MKYFRRLRYRIEYLDLKYPELKFILLFLIFMYFYFRTKFGLNFLFLKILCFYLAIVLHEISHGLVALLFGDNTAKRAGRLSLNPAKHLDLSGIILPATLLILGSPIIIGSAKPVPVNYNNLSHKKWGVFCVSIAGILMNLLLATFCYLIFPFVVANIYSVSLIYFLQYFFITNISLAVFNLLIIPPLDGSRIFRLALPYKFQRILDNIEANPFLSIFLILLVIRLGILNKLANLILSIFV